MSIEATLYVPPNGHTKPITIANIYDEDAAWFKAINAKISCEEVGGTNAMYADVGIIEDGEPVEAIELSMGRSCEDTMHALRLQAQAMLERREEVRQIGKGAQA